MKGILSFVESNPLRFESKRTSNEQIQAKNNALDFSFPDFTAFFRDIVN